MGNLLSMTGYGSAKGAVEGQTITVELKSVNNRYLDCSVRLPRNLLFAEDAVKQAISAGVSRGKVDVFVSAQSSQDSGTARQFLFPRHPIFPRHPFIEFIDILPFCFFEISGIFP